MNEQLYHLFYQPNALRKSEANFFNSLTSYYPASQTVNERFYVPESSLEKFVDTNKLCTWLQVETLLPAKKRLACIELLERCPAQLRVALQPKEISFDVVANIGDEIFYWEYHEKQHVRLSVDRPKHVYSPEGKRIEVPRYFQRLVRDVWRAIYFRPYTVVWQDWFEGPARSSKPFELVDGYREFGVEGKFSFEKLVDA